VTHTQQEEVALFEANIKDIEEIQAIARGIRLSKINQLLSGVDTVSLLGKLQKHGILRIIYNSTLDKEPMIQLTDKGKQVAIALLFSS
jgi:hypothetical protein